MSRTSKIVGFSLPPETHKKIEGLISKQHKTRSEFFRGMIDLYLESLNNKRQLPSSSNTVTEEDLGKVLSSYWTLKSQIGVKVIPIGLAIIVNKKGEILIGSRKEKDKWVENLSWVFPGGKFRTLDINKDLVDNVKREAGLDIQVNSLIASRIHPDAGFKKVQIVALYFHCTHDSIKVGIPSGDLKQLKWVKPTDVFKHFTTSTSDEVTKFLITLEKGT